MILVQLVFIEFVVHLKLILIEQNVGNCDKDYNDVGYDNDDDDDDDGGDYSEDDDDDDGGDYSEDDDDDDDDDDSKMMIVMTVTKMM